MGTLLQITGCIPAFFIRGKGALGPLSSTPAGASKRETPLNLTESTVSGFRLKVNFLVYLQSFANKIFSSSKVRSTLVNYFQMFGRHG